MRTTCNNTLYIKGEQGTVPILCPNESRMFNAGNYCDECLANIIFTMSKLYRLNWQQIENYLREEQKIKEQNGESL